MRSMTGIGCSRFKCAQSTFDVQIRSVNHRFKDLRIKLPRSLSALEVQIRKSVDKFISRGSVDVSIFESKRVEDQSIKINEDLAKKYYIQFQRLQKMFPGPDAPNWTHIPWTNILLNTSENVSDDDVWAKTRTGIKKALHALLDMQKKEGDTLQRFFKSCIKKLEQEIKIIQRLEKKRVPNYRKQIQNRLQEALNGDQNPRLDETRLWQEIVIYTDRIDITEEITRFCSHLKQFRDLIKADDQIGRKLEFIFQELNREANTMSAKANDAQLSHSIVEIKSLLEKLREQVQNVV